MDLVLESTIPVVTRTDIPPDRRVVTLDNSVFARLNGDETLFDENPRANSLRRLLRLMTDHTVREQYQLQFLVSQAVYYDRIRDNNDPVGSPLRLLISACVPTLAPSEREFIMEWPVARVPGLLAKMPAPNELIQKTHEGLEFEMRRTLIHHAVNKSDPDRLFREDMSLILHFCVYEPDAAEDEVARAFGFTRFLAVPEKRIADVCHAASHYRFAKKTDVLLSLDSDFRSHELGAIGVHCMNPQDFIETIDPSGLIAPVE